MWRKTCCTISCRIASCILPRPQRVSRQTRSTETDMTHLGQQSNTEGRTSQSSPIRKSWSLPASSLRFLATLFYRTVCRRLRQQCHQCQGRWYRCNSTESSLVGWLSRCAICRWMSEEVRSPSRGKCELRSRCGAAILFRHSCFWTKCWSFTEENL